MESLDPPEAMTLPADPREKQRWPPLQVPEADIICVVVAVNGTDQQTAYDVEFQTVRWPRGDVGGDGSKWLSHREAASSGGNTTTSEQSLAKML